MKAIKLTINSINHVPSNYIKLRVYRLVFLRACIISWEYHPRIFKY